MCKFGLVFIFIVVLCVDGYAKDDRVRVNTDEAGKVAKGLTHKYDIKNNPPFDENVYPSTTVFPTNSFEYWKKTGDDWVAMTQAEQEAADEVFLDKYLDDQYSDPTMSALIKSTAIINGITEAELKLSMRSNINVTEARKADAQKRKSNR
jgi:hypothetical protein